MIGSDVLRRKKILIGKGGARSVVFNIVTFDFYEGQSSVTEAILVHCGLVVPPIYNTRSYQTFTELCCLVCQQYCASKVLQRRYHCFN